MTIEGDLDASVISFERHYNHGLDAFGNGVEDAGCGSHTDSVILCINRNSAEKKVLLTGFIPGYRYRDIESGAEYTAPLSMSRYL